VNGDDSRFSVVQGHRRSSNAPNDSRTAQHATRRSRSERDDHLGLDDCSLQVLPPAATVDLVGIWPFVEPALATHFMFEVLHGVGDKHRFSIDARVGESPVQHASRRANERQSGEVFLITRLFTDQHHRRVSGAFSRNRLSCLLVKWATPTLVLCGSQRRQRSDNRRIVASGYDNSATHA
jgi:hypothetical protein